MEFSKSDTDTFMTLCEWRRDVRRFKTDPVPDAVLDVMQQAMAFAPSVGNSRPWRVVSVESPSLRGAVIENYASANTAAAAVYSDAKREEYQKLKLAGLKEAPVQLAVFTDPNCLEGHGLGRQTMPETLSYSTVAAIHQLWLAARTCNIGVGWVSILEPQGINDLLQVDSSWLFTAYLCIGYPEANSTEPELQRLGWQENTAKEWINR